MKLLIVEAKGDLGFNSFTVRPTGWFSRIVWRWLTVKVLLKI